MSVYVWPANNSKNLNMAQDCTDILRGTDILEGSREASTLARESAKSLPGREE